MSKPLVGLWPPVATPFRSDGSVDHARLVAHAKWLLAEGSTGLAALGTSSEANSLSVTERIGVIDALLEGGIRPDQLLPGNGAAAIDDVVTVSRHAKRSGLAGVLMLPPFYYKNVTDEGLFRFFATVIDRLGADAPKIALYHIPAMAGAGFSLSLIDRLLKSFPELIVGLKDSTGDAKVTLSIIESFPSLAVFPGAETYLVEAMGKGAAGCISLSANINPAGIVGLIRDYERPEAAALQAKANAIRAAVAGPTQIAAMKAVLSAVHGDAGWSLTRPPLVPFTDAERKTLLALPAIEDLLASQRQAA